MDLLLIGTNHRVADVEIRARVADAISALTPLLRDLGVTEYLALPTCHRAELYVRADDTPRLALQLRSMIVEAANLEDTVAQSALYAETGLDAARHLGRVACGLDSMVVGEAEIAGQIRRALAAARDAGTIGVTLDRIVAGALRASGRARAETRIGVGVLSAASAAVALVDQALGGLGSRSVLVVGAGQAGRQALARLSKLHSGPRFITSRSLHHADDAAKKFKAGVLPIDRLAVAAADVDAVIAATNATGHLLTVGDYRAVASGRCVFMVDLSAPRVLDPALADVDGVTLRGVDDLGDIVRQSTARRLSQIPFVEAIVQDEARRAYTVFRGRQERRVSGTATLR